jgi:peptidoglycan hydrolase-like protein with peptidoglycan-binding domain
MKNITYGLIVILILCFPIDGLAQERQDTTKKEIKTVKNSNELKKKNLLSSDKKNATQTRSKGTKRAVKSFQKKKKLGTDGIVGPKTRETIDNKKNKTNKDKKRNSKKDKPKREH